MLRKLSVVVLAGCLLLAACRSPGPIQVQFGEPSPTPAPVASAAPTVPPPPSPTLVPQFGPITFGTAVADGRVASPSRTFGPGTAEVVAGWSYQDLADGQAYAVAWYRDDILQSHESLTWDAGQMGSGGPLYAVTIGQPGAAGLPPGVYRVELSLGERLVQAASFAVLAPPGTPAPPAAEPEPDMQAVGQEASRSLVMIRLEAPDGSWTGGSGSIVDRDEGLILTNWHVVTTDDGLLVNEQGFARIWVTSGPDEPPALAYWARVLPDASDPAADLALLRVTHWLDGNRAVDLPLAEPAIPLGDSDAVRRGDRVLLLGYPGYAEETLAWTEDVVATLSDEWIETAATIGPGSSGGMMLNARGEMIGVVSATTDYSVRGYLALARPVNRARSLLEGGLAWQPEPAPTPAPEPAAEALVVLGTGALNLRAGPGTSHRVVAALPLGTVVERLGPEEWDGEVSWLNVRVRDSGAEGWASSLYLGTEEVARTPLLFTSDRDGSLDIYHIFPDGSGLERLTADPGDEGDPSWSPDRGRIAFTYAAGGDSDLYVMDDEGGAWEVLTSGPGDDIRPAWSPDGTRLAFVSNRDGDWEIWLLDLEGGGLEQLTFNDAWDSFPAWSPDGSRLVWTSAQTGNYDLFLLDLRSGAQTQLTTSPYSDAHPAWSPAGDEIAYTMVVEENGVLLREIGALYPWDPDHPRRVTRSKPSEALHRTPDWSPDGQWIVFESERDGNLEVYLQPARGETNVNLTRAPASADSAPVWSR